MDFVVITGLALIFLLLSWLYGRLVSSGQPLNTFKKTVLVYAFIFVLGMGYLMALVVDLHWPKDLLFPVVILWGGVVGFVAWVRRRREKRVSKESI